MAKLFSDLETITRTYLDEAIAADWTDSEVAYAINFAYHDVASQAMQVFEKYFDTITPFKYAIVSNQQEYAIDTSIIKVTRVEINYSPNVSTSQASVAIAVGMSEQLINLSNTLTQNTFGDCGYYLHGSTGVQTIGFIPVPQTADTGTTKSISVWAIALPSDLVNSTDNVNIPYADNYSYLICLRASSQLLSKGQQEEQNADRYQRLYEKGIEEMKNFLRDRQEDRTYIVQDDFLENTDFGFPL